ncbi:unnamed protein product [Polarella glacialis]|uniref:Uncharacterized protein n=2 Tax=Polarella glacialis TaxID=89957 RepID=A0A813F7L7_POLGL|nr:unnamed protein product [Polarella glacialis]
MLRNVLEPGPLVVFLGHFIYLLPHYYLLNALILAGRDEAEWTLRNAVLRSQVASGLLEVLWSAYCPKGLPHGVCAAAAGLCALLQGLHTFLAFTASPEVYHSSLAFALQLTMLVLLIPIAQIGTNHTLQRRISPARYRILGWLTCVVLAVSVLLSPGFGSLPVALGCSVAPFVVMAGVLLSASCSLDGAAKLSEAEPSKSEARRGLDDLRTGPATAGLFVVLGCGFGTIGEALTDMAITLSIRRSLQAGQQDLALTNQLVICLSMTLAYISETMTGANSSSKKGTAFILAWAACQCVRVLALRHLDSESFGTLVLAGMVFVDKYTGPLGAAALDMALLQLLETSGPGPLSGGSEVEGSGRSARGIPATFLWTLRMTTSRMERPICQLVLLNTAGVRVELLSCVFTFLTFVGVVAIFGRHWLSGSAQREKDD